MSELARDFDRVISGISQHLTAQNINKGAFAPKRRFQDLPEEIQHQAIARSRAQLEQMELLRPEVQEFEKLSVLCRFHKLRPVDDEVFRRLTGETAWEIIDFQLNQVYRNKLIFKLGHYSIEEYETYTPWDLFSRPQSIVPVLMEITQALKTAKTLVPLHHLSPYVIEEALSVEKAQFQITHDFVCPLMDESTGENRAFVSAFRLKAIPLSQKVVLFN